MARGLNKVTLIGNLTRDPEIRYTPSGSAVATFSIATNRQWKNPETGDMKDEVEFHRIVAWDKLAEICGQFLKKGRQVYVEGRLQNRKWQTKEGEDRYTTEIVINEMLMLGARDDAPMEVPEQNDIPDDFDAVEISDSKKTEKGKGTDKKADDKKVSKASEKSKNEPEDDDIPF